MVQGRDLAAVASANSTRLCLMHDQEIRVLSAFVTQIEIVDQPPFSYLRLCALYS